MCALLLLNRKWNKNKAGAASGRNNWASIGSGKERRSHYMLAWPQCFCWNAFERRTKIKGNVLYPSKHSIYALPLWLWCRLQSWDLPDTRQFSLLLYIRCMYVYVCIVKFQFESLQLRTDRCERSCTNAVSSSWRHFKKDVGLTWSAFTWIDRQTEKGWAI